jgi:hypothetical protein
VVIASCSIPLKQLKFYKMEPAHFVFTKAVAELENLLAAMGEEPFHAQFRRSLEILAFRGDWNYIAFGNKDGLTKGSINFKKPLVMKE